MRTLPETSIEWEGEKEIIELINELVGLFEKGHRAIEIETYSTGNGTTEEGGYEFEFMAGKLVVR